MAQAVEASPAWPGLLWRVCPSFLFQKHTTRSTLETKAQLGPGTKVMRPAWRDDEGPVTYTY